MTENTNTDVVVDDVDLAAPASIFDICGTDEDLIENGKWFEGSEIWSRGHGVKLKIRRVTSKASVKKRMELNSKYKKFEKNGTFPDQINERILNEQIAGALIVDWSGIRDREGKEIAYSPEAAAMLVDKLPDFRLPILQIAMNMDAFLADEVEKVEGN